MTLRRFIIPVLIALSFTLQSCKNETKTKGTFNSSDIETKRHILENDGIQLFLHVEFERYSASKYESLLDSLVNKKEFELERERLKNIRKLDGNNYIYYASNLGTTFLANTIPYAPIAKQDAQKLLGIIQQNQSSISKDTNVEFTRITAKFRALPSAQIFKAIFRVDEKKGDKSFFQQAYFINSNQKSILINITTPIDIDFDPYIEKMIF